MFESIFTATQDGTSLAIGQSVLSIITAMILGVIIGVVYVISCKKRCNRDFIIGLVLLPAIVSVVIMLVGSNVARAFSMAGAFALVRFRSAPGSAKDIAIVFFSMAAGLACGLGFITYAVIIVVLIAAMLLVMSAMHFLEKDESEKQLKVTIPENLNYKGAFDEVFNKFLSKATLTTVKTTNMGSLFELVYIVNLKAETDEKEFIDELRCRNGNLNITLGMIPDRSSTLLN